MEKPDTTFAREHLRTPGLPSGQYLCHFGTHVFTPAILDALDYLVRANLRERSEIQLTTAQEKVRADLGRYFLSEIYGKRYDAGVPAGLIEAQVALAMRSPLRDQLRTRLADQLSGSADG